MKKGQGISARKTITTRAFIENYLGLECPLQGFISHEAMEEYATLKGKKPQRVDLDMISIEYILRGNCILVRSEGIKKGKKAILIPYANPHRSENLILQKEKK